MKKFAKLIDQIYFTSSNLTKLALLKSYFSITPDPDRGYAVAAIIGALELKLLKRTLIKEILYPQVDPYLFELSYDYLGDFAETVAYMWPDSPEAGSCALSLTETVTILSTAAAAELKKIVHDFLNQCTPTERWALLKLGLSNLRIGVSARLIKKALAEYGEKDINEIEEIWHTLSPPYLELFAWLEHKAPKPSTAEKIFFHPIMLSHPLSEKELAKLDLNEFYIEWKFDGIRVQLSYYKGQKALFTRTGENISHTFPDALLYIQSDVVLDAELVVKNAENFGSFNELQKRLNRKKTSKALLDTSPAHLILYDILAIEGEDLRSLPLAQRRLKLQAWYEAHPAVNMTLSPLLSFTDQQSLLTLRDLSASSYDSTTEGLMLKRKDSSYIGGRPAGLWFKWKRNPLLIDAVLMYAQRGHGKRSSYYSDYTFGLWQDDKFLPIGKAYFGFTDEEMKQLDKWIRHHTVNKFGPVREVEKALVLEIAFDAVHLSKRHKSGYALRFPRINRIRWDKPLAEVEPLAILAQFL
jgi:DNA ligase-1